MFPHILLDHIFIFAVGPIFGKIIIRMVTPVAAGGASMTERESYKNNKNRTMEKV